MIARLREGSAAALLGVLGAAPRSARRIGPGSSRPRAPRGAEAPADTPENQEAGRRNRRYAHPAEPRAGRPAIGRRISHPLVGAKSADA